MAFGRMTRMDVRRPQQSTSSSYSTATAVLVFTLCLVAALILVFSTDFPVRLSSSDKKSDVDSRALPSSIVSFDDSSARVDDTVNFGDAANDENMAQDEADTVTSAKQKTVEKIQEELTTVESEEINGGNEGKAESLDKGDAKADEAPKDDGDLPDGDDKQRTIVEGSDESGDEEKSGEDGATDENSGSEETSQGNVEEKDDDASEGKELIPDGAQSELLQETATQNGSFSTQDESSRNEKKILTSSLPGAESPHILSWKLCKVAAGPDFIPCLDNEKAIKKLNSTKHYEHRERHCPENSPTCLVQLPEGYKRPIKWPDSRDKIWYSNVPHSKLAEVKGHQNWVKVSGELLTFPGGGTQFKHGAHYYIDFIQQSWSDIAWGRHSRVVLDVGCGVASFGGYLFDRDVLTMSFAPKDEHEAQVQFALERGIPAFSAVMGTKRLPFPSNVFDVIHCARCRVPWHIEGGMLLLELNRLLRPGGYFVWSATPVYQKLPEDVEIWKAMSALTNSMCWKMVNKTNDNINQVGLAIFQKSKDNKCYKEREENNPPLCQETDDANAAWNVPLQACMHKVPVDLSVRGSHWPEEWPLRVEKAPYWLSSSQKGVYGKPADEDFESDYEHWKRVVSKSYANGMGINWSRVRNVMDMNSVYGGFAAALRDMKVWVMNIVPLHSPDTLPIIYERGLFGMYHDWCESFSTYPRTYDLLHADHLFSKLKKRCKLVPVIAEVDRILRPGGKLIVRDDAKMISELEALAKSLQWEVRMIYSKGTQSLLCVEKTMWRPLEVEEPSP